MTELTPVAVLQKRMTQASRNGITYLRRSSESFTFVPAAVLVFAASGGLFHFRQLDVCLFRRAGAQQRSESGFFLAAAEQPARRFRHQETAHHEQHPRRQRHPEDAPPGLILEGKDRSGIGDLDDCFDAIAVVNADQRRRDDAERQQPLEDAGSFAAIRCREALRQVQRHHDADEAAADALQQPPEEQRPIAMRERNDRNADDECDAAEIISGLRPIQSASSPANNVEITLPSSTAATMIESWPAFRPEVASRYGSAPPMMPTSTP